MPSHDVISIDKKKTGQVDLSDKVFGLKVRTSLIHEAVKMYLANKRVGTASTKTRAEVRGSNKKPYRQKGTGRARQGTYSSPIFVGGGVAFGPKPRDFSLHMTKKKRDLVLKEALSLKLKENKLLIIDEWVEKKKTKEMAKVLKKLGVDNALIVLDSPLPWLQRSVSNIPYIDVVYMNKVNTYNIMARDFLVCTKDVVAKMQEGLEK